MHHLGHPFTPPLIFTFFWQKCIFVVIIIVELVVVIVIIAPERQSCVVGVWLLPAQKRRQMAVEKVLCADSRDSS